MKIENKYRIETDSIGEKEIPTDALYGINSIRAVENFPYITPIDIEWYKAMGDVKTAVYTSYKKFLKAINEQYPNDEVPLDLITEDVLDVLIEAGKEVAEGKHFDSYIVPALNGGAGTSINMNVNEIITNVALIKLGKQPGEYSFIDPFEDANVYQSTNDVVPTALRLALIRLIVQLEESVHKLMYAVKRFANNYKNSLRIGYTQMQAAVPSSYGKLFEAYYQALSRDRRRFERAPEIIKNVNLGGSAIGTAMGVPLFMVMDMTDTLQKMTHLPISRANDLSDGTSNLDVLAEFHGLLKTHAVNLEKIVNDIRLMASDVVGHYSINIPARQVGSSIMPGKINPVIPEFVISVSHSVYANDVLVNSLCGQGCIDLNAYAPAIGNNIISSIRMLIAANDTTREHLVEGLTINPEVDEANVYSSRSIATALNPLIGYKKSSEYSKMMRETGCNIFEANEKLKILDKERLEYVLRPENLLKTGFTISELMEETHKHHNGKKQK